MMDAEKPIKKPKPAPVRKGIGFGGWFAGAAAAVFLLYAIRRPSEKTVEKMTKTTKNNTVSVTEQAKTFVRDKMKSALDMQKKYGIPYLYSLAQWGFESNWGKSAPGFNFFGTKATGWKGKKQLLWTYEYITENGKKEKKKVQRWFRAYESWEQAVEDWARIIRLPHYKKAFSYKDDPRAFAREVAAGGYASSPTYANRLVAVIDKIEAEIKQQQNQKS